MNAKREGEEVEREISKQKRDDEFRRLESSKKFEMSDFMTASSIVMFSI